MEKKLKIGVLGAGHLGKIHMRCLGELTDLYEIVGFYDPSIEAAKSAEQEFGIPVYADIKSLIEACDAVDVVTPTLSHFMCAQEALRASKHVFIEKPITNTLEEAEQLVKLEEEAGVKIQVGHVERFNPAFVAARPHLNHPRFIEAHRLSEFNPRGTDVSVVLDLMIHDIDAILSVVNASIRRISASGVAVVSDNPDIANARIEFSDGTVANITASRISMKNMRKSRFFQKDAYITVDYFEKKVEVLQMQDLEGEEDPFGIYLDLGADKGKKQILFDKPEVTPSNAIKEELRQFALAIQNDQSPPVTVEDGYRALDVAYQVLDKMRFT